MCPRGGGREGAPGGRPGRRRAQLRPFRREQLRAPPRGSESRWSGGRADFWARCVCGARPRVRARRVGVLAGRRPDCGRRRARTRGRRNKSKVWTRKTHDALRAAGFRAAQLRDRLEWVDAQRRSGREHGEEARQRSHRKGTSRWATAAAGCRPSSNSQIRRTRLLDPGGLIARRMSASNTRLRIKEALVPSTKNTASSRPHRSLMHQIRRAQIPGRARARGLRPRA